MHLSLSKGAEGLANPSLVFDSSKWSSSSFGTISVIDKANMIG